MKYESLAPGAIYRVALTLLVEETFSFRRTLAGTHTNNLGCRGSICFEDQGARAPLPG